MRTHLRVSLILLSLVMLLAAVLPAVSPVSVAHATAAPITLPSPWWWVNNTGAFSQYDTYQYHYGRWHDDNGNGIHESSEDYAGAGVDSNILSSGAIFQGVAAIGPRPGPDGDATAFFTPDANAQGVLEWQCVELVKRYLFLKYGARPIAANGNEVVDNYATTYPNLFTRILNDGTDTIQPGDVLSYYSPDNHTAIVSDTSGLDANGDGTITILEQNVSATGIGVQDVQNWVIKNGVANGTANGDTIQYWLRGSEYPTWVDDSPAGTTTDWITSMAAPSTTTVFAAGYEGLPGYGKRPVVYRNNGTAWSKDLPSPVGSYYNHWLYGIAASSASDAWTVGEYTANGHLTLIYRWNGSSWTKVTSANPAPSGYTNVLMSVAYAGSNVFAAGVYWPNGSTKLPLLEKWNGTNAFTQQALSLPSGVSVGELKSVAFNSSTNGWAVGNAGTGTAQRDLIYRYNGSSWTPALGSIIRGNLLSVAVVSDDEAWAVGTQGTSNTPLLMHYTSANGWQEYTQYPPGIKLNSVAADSSSNVVIAGWDGSKAATLRNFGEGFTRVDIPADYSATNFQGVAVISGEAWAGGWYGGAPNPIVYHYR